MKLHIFSDSYSVHYHEFINCNSAKVYTYVIQVCRQLSSSSICSCLKAVYKPVWHIPLLSVQWINSWWWKDELYETCRVSCQNKFVTSVHRVGFITKKFIMMHSHTNIKNKVHRQQFKAIPHKLWRSYRTETKYFLNLTNFYQLVSENITFGIKCLSVFEILNFGRCYLR